MPTKILTPEAAPKQKEAPEVGEIQKHKSALQAYIILTLSTA